MTLKAGVIGLGVGIAHGESYASYPGCELKAVCDLEDSKLEAARQKFKKVKTVCKADEILTDKEINVVSIASYDNYHFEQVVKALENDKHVFVEKPLCLQPQEAEKIRKLLNRKKHLKLSSNLILRKMPRFIRIREEIQRGTFGSVFSLEGDYNYGRLQKITEGWRANLPFYSVVYGGGVHIIDLFQWLLGVKVEEVHAYGNKIATQGTKFRFNDFVSCLLKFENGAVAKMSANFACVMPHFHGLKIYGTKATFVNDLKSGRLYTSRDMKDKPEKISESYASLHKGGLIHNFLDSIVKGATPEVDANSVFDAMSVCFAIEQSVEENRPVAVDYL